MDTWDIPFLIMFFLMGVIVGACIMELILELISEPPPSPLDKSCWELEREFRNSKYQDDREETLQIMILKNCEV